MPALLSDPAVLFTLTWLGCEGGDAGDGGGAEALLSVLLPEGRGEGDE